MVNRMIEKIRVDAMINPGPKIIQSPCKKKKDTNLIGAWGFKKKRNPIGSWLLNWLNQMVKHPIGFRSCFTMTQTNEPVERPRAC